MSVEIANVIDAMVSFVATAADPVTIIDRSENIESVTFIAAGRYRVALINKIPTGAFVAPGSQLFAQANLAAASTNASAFEDALSVGDIEVDVRDLAGALAANGARVDLLVMRYPNRT